jgi:ribonuclease BN (tRNA processing enzyme)
LKLWVLGSGTTVPDGIRGPTGLLVELDSTRILIDGGTGTLHRLKLAGFDPDDLDGGVYSHRHLDHCGDLAPLLFTLKVVQRRRDYPIWGGEGLTAHLDGLRAVYGKNIQSSTWKVYANELPLNGPGRAILPGGLVLHTRPANHSEGALHLRFSSPSGHSVVFSGDTGPSHGLAELATGADLLVCECALAHEEPGVKHLWPEAVAEIVEAARPAQVVLTHFYPQVNEARALAIVGRCGVPVSRARDVQCFDVGNPDVGNPDVGNPAAGPTSR